MAGADRRMSSTFNCGSLAASITSRCGCNLTPAKLTCSGVPFHVDNLSCRVFHLGSAALTSSAHRAVCVILVFSSMLIWPRGRMFSGLQLVVLLLCASCAVFGARSRRLFTRHWLSCSLWVAWITVMMQLSSEFRPIWVVTYSLCLTLPHALSLHLDHITNTLASFHWLRVPERIQFILATLIYKSLHGLAPQYLVDDPRYITDIPGRRRLRPASSFQLEVPRTWLVTVRDRTFSAAGSRLWNSLPRDVTECQTLAVFRRKLKHFLFSLSFHGHWLFVCFSYVDLEVCT